MNLGIILWSKNINDKKKIELNKNFLPFPFNVNVMR